MLFVQWLSLQRQNVMKCKSENSGFCTVKVKVLWITSRMGRPGVLHRGGQWWSKPSLLLEVMTVLFYKCLLPLPCFHQMCDVLYTWDMHSL